MSDQAPRGGGQRPPGSNQPGQSWRSYTSSGAPPGASANAPQPSGGVPQLTPEQQLMLMRQQQHQMAMLARMRAAAFQQQAAPSLIPYVREMDEQAFLSSLARFLHLGGGLTLRRVPEFAGRPVALHRLLRAVASLGGFARVTEAARWPDVCTSMGYAPPAVSPEQAAAARETLAAQLRGLYATLLLPYEQHYLHGIPIPSVTWQHAPASAPLANTSSVPAARPPPRKPLGAPHSQSFAESLSALRSDTLAAVHEARRLAPVEPVTYEHLALMVACPDAPVRASALGVLERVAFEVSRAQAGIAVVGTVPFGLPSPSALSSLLTVLAGLLADTVGPGEGIRTSSTGARSALVRNTETTALSLSSLVSASPCGERRAIVSSIANTLRSWSFRQDLVAGIGAHEAAMRSILRAAASYVTSACDRNVMTADTWRALLLVLCHAAPHVDADAVAEDVGAFLAAAALEIAALQRDVDRVCVRLLPFVSRAGASDAPNVGHSGDTEGGSDAEGTDATKRTIVALHQASVAVCKSLPQHLFLLLETVARILARLAPPPEHNADLTPLVPVRAPLPARHPAASGVHALCAPLALMSSSLAAAFLPPFAAHVARLLAAPDFCAAAHEYGRWMAMVVHNPGFGLPDCGLAELASAALVRVLVLAREPALDAPSATRAFRSLLRSADACRRLWTYDPAPQAGSPLSVPDGGTPSPLAATIRPTLPGSAPAVPQALSSQPYTVLCRVTGALALLARDVDVTSEDAAVLLGWLHPAPPASACRELLMRADLLAAVGAILGGA